MLIRPEILEKVILSYEDYIELMGLPEGSSDDSQKQERVTKWINQATQQFDSLVSPQGQGGKLYKWFEGLDLSKEEDKMKGYKLQLAIAQWVETFIISGKFWVDNVPSINSNFNVDIDSSSQDSAVEFKRLDIIQTLVSIGLYYNSNIISNNSGATPKISQHNESFVEWLDNHLIANYLNLSPQSPLTNTLDLSKKGIANTGYLKSGAIGKNLSIAEGYSFQNCAFNKEEITSLRTDMILDPLDNKYKKINMFDVEYFGGMKRQEIVDTIASLTFLYDPEISYHKDTVVKFLTSDNHLSWALSLIENNKGNDPETSPLYWRVLPNEPIDIDAIINEIKPLLPAEIQKILDSYQEITVFSTTQSDARYFKKPEGATFSDLALTNQRNTFSELQTFEKGITTYGTINGDVVALTRGLVDVFGNVIIDIANKYMGGNWTIENTISSKVDVIQSINIENETTKVPNSYSVKEYVDSKSGGTQIKKETIVSNNTGVFFIEGTVLEGKIILAAYPSGTANNSIITFFGPKALAFRRGENGPDSSTILKPFDYKSIDIYYIDPLPVPSRKKQKVKANKKSPKALARQKRQERRYKHV